MQLMHYSALSIPSIANEPDIDDNSLLVPIGGRPICDDVAPTVSRLGQVEVDREIAKIIAIEEHEKLENAENNWRGRDARLPYPPYQPKPKMNGQLIWYSPHYMAYNQTHLSHGSQ